MRAKIYEKYYKRGLGYLMLKGLMGLKKPNKSIKRFYYTLIIFILLMGKIIFG